MVDQQQVLLRKPGKFPGKRVVLSSIMHASNFTLNTSVMARDVRKTYVISCPSYLLWFERFMMGMDKNMRDEIH